MENQYMERWKNGMMEKSTTARASLAKQIVLMIVVLER
jgi:hypothetical protein